MQFIAPYSLVGHSANLALHLHPDHLADLRASGLNDETIRLAGVYSLRPKDFTLFFNARKNLANLESVLCFPYQGGEFARIKLFPFPSILDSRGKPMKYSQPSGTGARLYMPFEVKDAAVYICEGEKKTLAAHQAGMNAAGIGGLWNWLTNGEPIDDLKLIEWDYREVVIIPDSDVFQRQDLLRAVYALGRELRERGAAVSVAEIPQPGQKKIGLDDYLVAGGRVEDLETLTLGGKAFRSASFWYGRWKMKATALAA
jgi:putative DNA primase/helicase